MCLNLLEDKLAQTLAILNLQKKFMLDALPIYMTYGLTPGTPQHRCAEALAAMVSPVVDATGRFYLTPQGLAQLQQVEAAGVLALGVVPHTWRRLGSVLVDCNDGEISLRESGGEHANGMHAHVAYLHACADRLQEKIRDLRMEVAE